jgi:hypothetical protein
MSYRTRFRVRSVPKHDPHSGESCLELEATTGARIRVFFHDPRYPPLELNEGDVVEAGVDCEVETDFETIFSSNVNHEYRCEPVDNWGCIFSGKIVALRGGTPIVDCGGIYVPMDNLTHDQRLIGDWVQFKAYLVTLSDPRPVSTHE